MSKIILQKAVWVTNPDSLQCLDTTSPESLERHTSLTDDGLEMTECGWVRIGDAEVTYKYFRNLSEVTPAMCKHIDEAIAKLEAATYQKVMELKAQKNKLLALEMSDHA